MKPVNEQKKKRLPWWARVLLILVVLLALLTIGGLWFVNHTLNLISFDTAPAATPDVVVLEGATPPPPTPEPTLAPPESHRDEVFNVLLLGTDERSNKFSDNARADSIMLVSLDTYHDTIKLASIERGIGVPVPGRNDDWITHTFRYGGADLTLQTVRDCFGVDVDHYVRINFHAFKNAINSIGGVDVDLVQREADALQQAEGTNHMDGSEALDYSRLRHIDSDWKRIERQRKVVKAGVQQIKENFSLTQIPALVEAVLPTVQTNLTKTEIAALMLQVPGFLKSDAPIDDLTIPTKDTCWNSVGKDGRKMIAVDFEANAKILDEFFYPEEPEYKEEPAPQPTAAPTQKPGVAPAP